MKILARLIIGLFAVLVLAIGALAVTISYTEECDGLPTVTSGVELMRAVQYRCYGGPEVLEFVEVPKPQPGDNQVLVRVLAAAVNPLDWHYMRGSPYIMRLDSGIGAPKNPGLGVDFAGIVEAVGANVTKFEPGDEVFGGRNGAFAEYVVIGQDSAIARMPPNVTFEEAAAVPIAAITALQALRDKANVQPGDKVLINGASGGVGTFAVQIAKDMGAEVTGVCSTRNVQMVRILGADHVFDYTKENYTTASVEFDAIIDLVGNHPLSANRRVMADDGIMVIVGAQKGDWLGPLAAPLKAVFYRPFVSQDFVMLLSQFNQQDFETLAAYLEDGTINPQLDRIYPFDAIPEAMRLSESGRAQGKIVIKFD